VQWDGNGTPRLAQGQAGYAPRNEFRKTPPAGAELAGVVREQSRPPNSSGDRIALRANIRGGAKLLLERATIEVKSAVDDKGRALVVRPQPPMTNLQRRLLGETQAEVSFDIPQPPPTTIVSLAAEVVAQTPKSAKRITLAPLPEEPTIVKLSEIEVRIGPMRQENQQVIIDITGINVAAVPVDLQWFREVSRLRIEDGKQRMTLRVLNAQQQDKDLVMRCQLILPSQRPATSIDKAKAKLVWDVITDVDTVRFPIEAKGLAIP
jgi:hypothetical protein